MTRSKFNAMHTFICQKVRDAVNENIADALLQDSNDASAARTLLRFRSDLQLQTVSRMLDDYAIAELTAILRKKK